MTTRRHVLNGLASAAAMPWLGTAAAWAQVTTWRPEKPIDFLVMSGPGGGADLSVQVIVATIKARKWSDAAFTIRHLPERNGLDALNELGKRTRDPHVLLFTLNSFYTAPLGDLGKGLDIARFAPIARLSEDAFLLWVNATRDVHSFEDFQAAARDAGPGWIMGGTGTDSEDQLLTDFLNTSFGLRMSYRKFDGGGAVAAALASGEIASSVNNPSETRRQHMDGKVRPVASFSRTRLPLFKSVPCLREFGMAFTYSMQRSVVGPPSLPVAASRYYVALFETLYDSLEWQTYCKENSMSGNLLSGSELMSYWLSEREKHKRWLTTMKMLRG